MPYRIEFVSSASREFSKLAKSLQQRIASKIDALASQPRPRGVEKLEGQERRYR